MKKIIFVLALVSALFVSCNKADLGSLNGKYTEYKSEFFFNGELVDTVTPSGEEVSFAFLEGHNLQIIENGNLIILPYKIDKDVITWGIGRQFSIKIISKNEIAISYLWDTDTDTGEVKEMKYQPKEYDTYKGVTIYKGGEYESNFCYQKDGKYYHCAALYKADWKIDGFYDVQWIYLKK